MQEKSDSKNERKGGESLDGVTIRDSGTEEKTGGGAGGSRDSIVELLLRRDQDGSVSGEQCMKFRRQSHRGQIETVRT